MNDTQPLTPSRYFVFVDGHEYDGAEAFALAEFLAIDVMADSNGKAIQPVYTIRNKNGDVLSSFTQGRIVGFFLKQQWDGRSHAVHCSTEAFEATAHVMGMTHEAMLALENHRENTGRLGQAHVQWEGPCEVEIVEQICAHFGVTRLSDITRIHFESVSERWRKANASSPATEPEPPRVTPKLIGEFVDGVSDRAGVARRTPKAVAGRLIEEVVELALAAGVAPGKIFEHVTDSLHNQALKASRKTSRTVFPSQIQEVEGDDEGITGECADVSMVFKDFCWVAKVQDLDQIEARKNQTFMRLGDYNVVANGCIYRHKAHVKTV